MLDFDLVVKRNIKRFPKDFMFQLTKNEWGILRLQIETSKSDIAAILVNRQNVLRLQIETLKGKGGTRYLPYAFTKQGLAMLSGILNSNKAIDINNAIFYF